MYPSQSEFQLARKLRCSPLYSVLEKRGAVFGMRMGYERPLYFDSSYQRNYDFSLTILKHDCPKCWTKCVDDCNLIQSNYVSPCQIFFYVLILNRRHKTIMPWNFLWIFLLSQRIYVFMKLKGKFHTVLWQKNQATCDSIRLILLKITQFVAWLTKRRNYTYRWAGKTLCFMDDRVHRKV